jgi:hypothetical protein
VETETMNNQIREFKPHVALDIHSGMLGMLTPNGAANIDDKNDPLNPLIAQMKNLLDKVAAKYCRGCLVGEAYKVLHYESYGTFIDHNLYENDVPIRFLFWDFSICWEIFGDNSTLRARLLH